MGDPKFYAVRAGHTPGVYTQWADCLSQVKGFKKAKFKSFATREDAEQFMKGSDPSLDPSSSKYQKKFYGVRSGKVPGVYTDWASAEQQVVGVTKPKVKVFGTHAEAQAFVDSAPPEPTEGKKRTLEVVQKEAEEEVLEVESPVAKKRKSVTETEMGVASVDATPPEETSPKSRKKGTPLRIYTDGSALGNGKDSSIAGVGVWFGDRDQRNISEPLLGPRQTNQRAELTAIQRAISVAPLHRDVIIYTDSQYAINCVTIWFIKWVKNEWITSVGRPVENRDLIESILDIIRGREDSGSKTRFEWVKGHSGVRDGNSEADRLAVEGARMAACARDM